MEFKKFKNTPNLEWGVEGNHIYISSSGNKFRVSGIRGEIRTGTDKYIIDTFPVSPSPYPLLKNVPIYIHANDSQDIYDMYNDLKNKTKNPKTPLKIEGSLERYVQIENV